MNLFRKQGELLFVVTAFIYLQSSYLKIWLIKRQRKKEKLHFFKASACERMLREGSSVMYCLHSRLKYLGLFFFSWYIVKSQHNLWKRMKLNPDTCISVIAIWEYRHSSSELEVLWAVCGLLTFKRTAARCMHLYVHCSVRTSIERSCAEQGCRLWELMLSLFMLTGLLLMCFLALLLRPGRVQCFQLCFWAWILHVLLQRGNPNTLQFSATCPLMPDFL